MSAYRFQPANSLKLIAGRVTNDGDGNGDCRGQRNEQRRPEPNYPKAKLPRDACVTVSTDPPELYISLTIRKPEHVQALLDTLNTFVPMLHEYER